MTLTIYLQCFGVAFLGCVLQAAMYLRGVQQKSKLANVEFNIGMYFKNDWLSIVISFVTILLFLSFTSDIVATFEKASKYLKLGFAFIGYFSQDIAARFFGALNKRVNEVIDQKTTAADQASGNVTPTPLK
jgi:hypothetical protein